MGLRELSKVEGQKSKVKCQKVNRFGVPIDYTQGGRGSEFMGFGQSFPPQRGVATIAHSVSCGRINRLIKKPQRSDTTNLPTVLVSPRWGFGN